MAKQEFYEVDGCHHFVPVEINEAGDWGANITILGKKTSMVVDRVYCLPKPDQPQKVVVPKFVAEWYSYAKETNFSLRQALEHWLMSEELVKWFQYSSNQETFARAWLDGYEVEQERLYTVEIPNPNVNAHTILQKQGNKTVLVVARNARWRGWADSKLTESEIKQDFEWAWDAGFAKEV
ncbi:TPA: DUF1642 domain-containing protein [Streptococcus suis]